MSRRPRNPGSAPEPEFADKGTAPAKKRRGLGNRKNTAADDAAEAARRKLKSRVFEMRCLGGTFERIAAECGISESSARDYYRQGSLAYGKESAEEHKAKANARFDSQLVTLRNAEVALRGLAAGKRSEDGKSWEREPDPEVSSVLTSNIRAQAYIVKEQARMNGSYAPDKVEHTGAGGGPVQVSLDEVLGTITRVGSENQDGVEAARGVTH